MQYPLFVEIDEMTDLARLALNAWALHEEDMARMRDAARKPMKRAEDFICWNRREDAG